MATKKTVKKEAEEKKEAVKEPYFYGLGRRKASVAQVRLYASDKATEDDFMINGKKMKVYFPTVSMQTTFAQPLRSTGHFGKFRVSVLARGGGVTGQVEASRLGIARALIKFDETLKKSLKSLGYLTRDSREVERKKPGLKKARKAPQWAKR